MSYIKDKRLSVQKKTRPHKLVLFLIFCMLINLSFLVVSPKPTAAAVSSYINYQGKLLDTNGIEVDNGQYHVRFKMYNHETAGSLIWTSTYDQTTQTATLDAGLFTLKLGELDGFPATLDFQAESEYWLSVEIGGSGGAPSWDGEMTPRKEITAVAYAMNSDKLDGKSEEEFADLDEDETITGKYLHNVEAFDGYALNVQMTASIDAGVDILSALKIDTTQDSIDNDHLYGLYVTDLQGVADEGNEYAIYQAGTAWDYGLYIEDDGYFGLDVTVTDQLFLTSSHDLVIGNTALNESGFEDAGAYLVGAYDEFDNSNSTNVQDVLDDLDAAIGSGGAGLWTDAGSYTYLTASPDDVVFGSNATVDAEFYFNTSSDAVGLFIDASSDVQTTSSGVIAVDLRTDVDWASGLNVTVDSDQGLTSGPGRPEMLIGNLVNLVANAADAGGTVKYGNLAGVMADSSAQFSNSNSFNGYMFYASGDVPGYSALYGSAQGVMYDGTLTHYGGGNAIGYSGHILSASSSGGNVFGSDINVIANGGDVTEAYGMDLKVTNYGTVDNLYGGRIIVEPTGIITGNAYGLVVSASGDAVGSLIQLSDIDSGSAGYAIDMNGLTVDTADIRLSNGETISNTTDGVIGLSEDLAVGSNATSDAEFWFDTSSNSVRMFVDASSDLQTASNGAIDIDLRSDTHFANAFNIDLVSSAGLAAGAFLVGTSSSFRMNSADNANGGYVGEWKRVPYGTATTDFGATIYGSFFLGQNSELYDSSAMYGATNLYVDAANVAHKGTGFARGIDYALGHEATGDVDGAIYTITHQGLGNAGGTSVALTHTGTGSATGADINVTHNGSSGANVITGLNIQTTANSGFVGNVYGQRISIGNESSGTENVIGLDISVTNPSGNTMDNVWGGRIIIDPSGTETGSVYGLQVTASGDQVYSLLRLSTENGGSAQYGLEFDSATLDYAISMNGSNISDGDIELHNGAVINNLLSGVVSLNADLTPSDDSTFDLGSSDSRWQDGYFAGDLYLGQNIYHDGDLNTYLGFPDTNDINIYSNGYYALNIDGDSARPGIYGNANTQDYDFNWHGSSSSYLFKIDAGAERVGIDVGLAPAEKLDVGGAIKIGTTANTNAGTIRWSGSDFEGYDGSDWLSLTYIGGDILWTDAGEFTYLTETTGDVVMGSSTTNDAAFWFDVSNTVLHSSDDLYIYPGTNLLKVYGNIYPSNDSEGSIGGASNRWNNAYFSGVVSAGDGLIHDQDPDTFLYFSDNDDIQMDAGGYDFLHFDGDAAQKVLIGNYTNQDIDFRWDDDTSDSLFYIDALGRDILMGAGTTTDASFWFDADNTIVYTSNDMYISPGTNLLKVYGNIYPSNDSEGSIGGASNRWNNAYFSGVVSAGDGLIHDQDPDTFLYFSDNDDIQMDAGGYDFLHFDGDAAQKVLIGNYTNQDVDFRWDGDLNDSIFLIDALAESIYLNGNSVYLGDASTDKISFEGRVNTDILPFDDDSYSFGSSDKRWEYGHFSKQVFIGETLKLADDSIQDTDGPFNFYPNNDGDDYFIVSSDATNMHIGTGGAADLYVESGGDQMLFQNATDVTTGIQFLDTNGGTPIMNIDTANERVGIGMNNPSYPLDVTGAVQVTSTQGIGVNHAPNNGYGIWAEGSTMGGRFEDSNGTATTYVGYSTYGLYTAQDGYFGGDVGIGTSNAGAKLDVQKTSTSGTAGIEIGINTTFADTGAVASGTDITYGQFIDLDRTGAVGGTINTYGIYSNVLGDTGGTSTAVGGYFTASGADNNYGLLVGNGNVGIGTSGPDYLLQIAQTTGAIMAIDRVDTTIADTNDIGSLYFTGQDSDSTNNVGAYIQAEADGTWASSFGQPTQLTFHTQDSQAATSLTDPRMIIDSNGYVGIGLGSDEPDAPFHLKSDKGASAFRIETLSPGTEYWDFVSGSQGDLDWYEDGSASDYRVRFQDGGGVDIYTPTSAGTTGDAISIYEYTRSEYWNIGVDSSGNLRFMDDSAGNPTLFMFQDADSLWIKSSSSSNHAIDIEETGAGVESWQIGVDTLGNLSFFNSESATASVTFEDTGNEVGIGTITPGAKLEVQDDDNVGVSFIIDSEETTSTQDIFRIYTDVGSDEDLQFKIQADGDTFNDGTAYGGPADFAEYFYDGSGSLSAGQIVAVDTGNSNGVVLPSSSADEKIFGIISTEAAFIGNWDETKENNPNWVIVTLTGQVPTIVNDENGAIAIGDYITSSSTAGEGMKANLGDPTVGIALEPLASGSDTIQVVVSRNNGSNATSSQWADGANGLYYGDDAAIIGSDSAFNYIAAPGAGDLKVGDELEVNGNAFFGSNVEANGSFIAGNTTYGDGTISDAGALDISSGAGQDLTLDSASGTLKLGAGTNEISNTDAGADLTINSNGDINFFNSNNSIDSSGNLDIAGSLQAAMDIIAQQNVIIKNQLQVDQIAVDDQAVITVVDEMVFEEGISISQKTDYTGSATQVNSDGFGNSNNQTSNAAAVYNGKLYIGTNNPTDGSELWSYDGTSWASADTGGFGSTSNDSINSMIAHAGRLFIGTNNDYEAEVWTCDDTDSCAQENLSGSFDGNNDTISAITVHDGKLYIGTDNPNDNSEVWQYIASGDWVMADDVNGFTNSSSNSKVSAMISSNAQLNNAGLLGGTEKTDGAELWKFEGNDVWTRIDNNGADSFGDTNNTEVMSMIPYNGQVYIGTKNANGCMVYKQNDDLNHWDEAGSAGLLGTAYTECRSLVVYNGELYALLGKTSGAGMAVAKYDVINNDWTSVYTNGSDTAGYWLQTFAGKLYFPAESSSQAQIFEYEENTNLSEAIEFEANGETAALFFKSDAAGDANIGQESAGAFIMTHTLITNSGSYDLAEDWPTEDPGIEAGDVVAVDPFNKAHIIKGSNETSSVGIVSTEPGYILSQEDDGRIYRPVALAGRVPVKITDENGPVKAGDLLTPASTPGYAKKLVGSGSVIGKALEDYNFTEEGDSYEVSKELQAAAQEFDQIAENNLKLAAETQDIIEALDANKEELENIENNNELTNEEKDQILNEKEEYLSEEIEDLANVLDIEDEVNSNIDNASDIDNVKNEIIEKAQELEDQATLTEIAKSQLIKPLDKEPGKGRIMALVMNSYYVDVESKEELGQIGEFTDEEGESVSEIVDPQSAISADFAEILTISKDGFLVVEANVKIFGDLYVKGNLVVDGDILTSGNLEVGEKIYVSSEMSGTAMIASADSTFVEVKFETPYEEVPRITVTPELLGLTDDENVFEVWDGRYVITQKSNKGFIINIADALCIAEDLEENIETCQHSLRFDWVAFGVIADEDGIEIEDEPKSVEEEEATDDLSSKLDVQVLMRNGANLDTINISNSLIGLGYSVYKGSDTISYYTESRILILNSDLDESVINEIHGLIGGTVDYASQAVAEYGDSDLVLFLGEDLTKDVFTFKEMELLNPEESVEPEPLPMPESPDASADTIIEEASSDATPSTEEVTNPIPAPEENPEPESVEPPIENPEPAPEPPAEDPAPEPQPEEPISE